ncbi:Glyoxalase/Bleomycin resistance protein/Dihydroxybiphenyl dioxygenase [Penicillium sp. IBT 18751x]|nr:Glyoxalase/Bleomycin resistance protein/Dihydroxybiphenyl dioxygenase [Penicillium sp. IBT 18751x]
MEFTEPFKNVFDVGEYVGEHDPPKKTIVAAQDLIGLEMFLIIEDLDGNLVEIQQQCAPNA